MKQVILLFSFSILLLPTLSSQVVCLTGNTYQEVDQLLMMIEISLANRESELLLTGRAIPLSLAVPITSKEKKYIEEAVLESSKNFDKKDLSQFEEMFTQLRLEDKNYNKDHQNEILVLEMIIRILNEREE